MAANGNGSAAVGESIDGTTFSSRLQNLYASWEVRSQEQAKELGGPLHNFCLLAFSCPSLCHALQLVKLSALRPCRLRGRLFGAVRWR
jgi:hypothetical protein